MLDIYSRSILEDIHEAFIAIDPQWHIVYVNHQAEFMLQKTQTDLLGRDLKEVFPENISAVLYTMYNEAVDNTDIIHFNAFFPLLKKWFAIHAYPLKERLIVYLSDITERKQMESALRTSEQLKQAILDSLTAHIAVVDSKGRIIAVNEAWEEYARANGGDREYYSSVGINYLDVCRATTGVYAPFAMQAFEGIQSVLQGIQNQFVLEYPCPTTDLENWYMMTVTPLPQVPGAVVSHSDITERKALDQRKDEFISIASHELQTPITTLSGLIQLLERKIDKQSEQKSLAYLAQMKRQVNTITKLVTDLLDVSKIQAGKLDYLEERVDIDACVREIADMLQQIHTSHTICVYGQTQKYVLCDKDNLNRVFINIITNAIKYSPQADHVDVTISVSDNMVVIGVRDYGIGIPRAQQEKIFERFYRVYLQKEKTSPGLGMGLFISSEIIKHYGGAITIESEIGQGALFAISLPFSTR